MTGLTYCCPSSRSVPKRFLHLAREELIERAGRLADYKAKHVPAEDSFE